MMSHVVSEGTARRAALDGIPTAGKTGTTNAYRDAWFVGYTGNFTCAVWYGNDDYSPTNRMTGGSCRHRPGTTSWSPPIRASRSGNSGGRDGHEIARPAARSLAANGAPKSAEIKPPTADPHQTRRGHPGAGEKMLDDAAKTAGDPKTGKAGVSNSVGVPDSFASARPDNAADRPRPHKN